MYRAHPRMGRIILAAATILALAACSPRPVATETPAASQTAALPSPSALALDELPAQPSGPAQAAETALPPRETTEPAQPVRSQTFQTFIEAQQSANFQILAPYILPAELPLSEIGIDEYADGHQEIYLTYGQPSGPRDRSPVLRIIQSNDGAAVTQESVTNQSKRAAQEVKEIGLRSGTAYLYRLPSVSAGVSTWLVWQENGVTYQIGMSGDWPGSAANDPYVIEQMITATAYALDLPTEGWQVYTSPESGVSFAYPPDWSSDGNDSLSGPGGFVRLEAWSGPGANVGMACEYEANAHQELYGDSPELRTLPRDAGVHDPYGDPCLIRSMQTGQAALLFDLFETDESETPQRLILRMDAQHAGPITTNLQVEAPGSPVSPTLSEPSIHQTPDPAGLPEDIWPVITRASGLVIEQTAIVSADKDYPGWFEFTQRIPAAVLERHSSERNAAAQGRLDALELDGKVITVTEEGVQNPFGWSTQAQVAIDGEVVYRYNLLPYAAVSRIFRLGAFDGHWILEVNGILVVDGEIVNDDLGTIEIFDWSLLDGKPLYFFTRDGKTFLSYNGETLPVQFERVIHKQCCEPAAFNVGSNDQIAWFYALQDGAWQYVEIFPEE